MKHLLTNNKSWWKTNKDKEIELFRQLEDGHKTFTELLKELKWGSQTLTNYLKHSEKDGCINKSPRCGRKYYYTLIRSNPHVKELLKWSWPTDQDKKYKIIIRNRIKLKTLNEQQFINQWHKSITFSLANIIYVYRVLGEHNLDENTLKKMKGLLGAYLSDLGNTIKFYGEALAQEVKQGILDPQKIWEEQRKLV